MKKKVKLVKVTAADAPTCPTGQIWDPVAGQCVDNPIPPDPTHPPQ